MQATHSRPALRRRWAFGVAGVGMAVVGGTVLPAAPAQSVPIDPSCPDPAPVAGLTAGDPVTGLTVSQGTTPDEFSGEVVGVLSNGIAAGLDMIVVKLDGSVITDPNTGEVDRGIWAGMSGSPVYDANDNLIGAVSYSLAWAPSEYAGVTPAEDMYAIQQNLGAGKGAARVDVKGKVAKVLAADPDLGKAAVADGFKRLPMKITVSGGLSTKRVREIADRGGLNPRRFQGGVGMAAAADPIPVEAGGNLVASAAYGDISLTGTGTATAVCDGNVIGFGHPMLFSGRSQMTMHGASTLFIQRDDAGGSFKVAEPGAPIGSILQDRLAGILGQAGALPPTTVIHSDVTSTDTGASRSGTTDATSDDYLGYATALHTYQNLLRVFDQEGPGSDLLTWSIQVTTSDNRQLTMTRSSAFASRWSAAEEPVYEIWDDVDSIVNNPYDDVTIDSVDVTGSITEQMLELRIGKVERRVGGSWVVVKKGSNVKAERGSTLALRVTLAPRGDSTAAAETARLDLKVPAKQKGRWGDVLVAGQGFNPNRREAVHSIDEYLDKLSATPGDDTVSAQLSFGRRSGSSTDQATADAAVRGFFSFGVRLKK